MDVYITLVRADDWQGLYINNVLFGEGHRVELDEVLFYLAKRKDRVVGYNSIEVDDDWMSSYSSLPNDLSQIPHQAIYSQ